MELIRTRVIHVWWAKRAELTEESGIVIVLLMIQLPFSPSASSGMYMHTEAVACHHATHSVYFISEEEDSYHPVPCIQIYDG